MLGLAFAACRSTASSARRPASTARRSAPSARPGAVAGQVGVRFDANVHPGLPWRFEPEQTHGPRSRPARRPRSSTGRRISARRAITGQAVFNVTPDTGRQIFQQDPVLLLHRADAEAGRDGRHAGGLLRRSRRSSKDPDTKDIDEITLSYTFYPVETDASGPLEPCQTRTREAATTWPRRRTTIIIS